MRLFTIKSLEPTIHVTHVVHAELKALSVCGSVIYIYIFEKMYVLFQKCIHFWTKVYTLLAKSVYTF